MDGYGENGLKTSRLKHFEITEIRDRLSVLKIYCGKETKKLARNLPDTARLDGDDVYKKLKRKLVSHFFPKKNKHHARLTFSKQKRIEGESVVTQKKKLEETSRDLPENKTTRKKRKRKAKVVVTVERQEHTLQAETTQHTDNNVSSVVSTIIMHRAAELVPKPKRDITRPREGKPDSGPSANVMNEYQFKALKHR